MPCTAAAAATCAGPSEPCFLDESCLSGGLGCNAGGYELCRFCGFGQYSVVDCPVPCTAVVGKNCEGPEELPGAQQCYLDERCRPKQDDPYDGIGCNAGGHQRCRFCEVGAYKGIECPEEKLEYRLTVEATIETFSIALFLEKLARFLGLPEANIEVRVAPASLVVTSIIKAGNHSGNGTGSGGGPTDGRGALVRPTGNKRGASMCHLALC